MKRTTLSIITLLLLIGLALAVSAQAGERKADGTEPVGKVKATPAGNTLGVGTITFDNNTPFRRDGTDGGTVGNLFDPAGNPHSIASVSFALAGNFSTSVVMTVWDVNAASVQVLQRQLVSGASQSPSTAARFNAVLTAAVVGHTGPFIAGIRNTDYNTCIGSTALGSTCDGVALTQGTSPAPPVASRGARVNFTSASFVPTITNVATTGQSLGDTNAIFRPTGDNLPVELMSFSID